MEIINQMNIPDLINFCQTSYAYKNNQIIRNKILSEINTNYILDNFTLNQLFIFYKTNNLHKKLHFMSTIVVGKYDNNIRIYDCEHQRQYDLIVNIDMNMIYQVGLYCVSVHGEMIKDILSSKYLGAPPYKQPTIFSNNKSCINADGECYQHNCNFRKIPIKNVVQKSGCFILTLCGSVYVELNNGYIYNPMTKKNVNFNKYVDWSLTSTYKYYPLKIKNIKEVTLYLLYLHNNSLYLGNINISDNANVVEMHISDNNLIYYTDDNQLVGLNLLNYII